MLGSLSSHEEEDEEEEDHLDHHHPHHTHHMRRLLISCAELISQSDFSAARRLISRLSTTSSPYGDSNDRLVHQFVTALSLRVNPQALQNLLLSPSSSSSTTFLTADTRALHSSYLSLNKITPFIRFCHLTANQSILEATQGHHSIHILDLDSMQGVQWPPFMQAIADRAGLPSLNPLPAIRITGVGHDLNTLCRTRDRLQMFAQSLGLNFQFHPLHLHDKENLHLHLPRSISILPDEALAVNCVLFLHKLHRDDSPDAVGLFLNAIKAMNPKVVTVAEREAGHNHPNLLQRFREALDHYGALFDSLEATLPPNSAERLSVEQVWFGKEIVEIVGGEGEARRERHERFEKWAEIMRSSGFTNTALSAFALSQAKLLLRLHYPSDGYHLQILNDSFFLGWEKRALFSVSSWH